MAQERLVNFEEIWKLGEGSFGSVFKVRHRKTKDIYVLKKISTVGMSYEDRNDAKQEFLIHRTIKNDYIWKYESHFVDKGYICILLEYMDGGDVGQYLKKLDGKLLPESKVWDFFIQTCIGLQYLHARKILHRDLKTINLFLHKDGRLKIGDLGVAKEVLESHTNTIVGTPYYLSPELWEEKPYNNKSDIWSLGCILYELCTWKHPFDAKTQGGLFLKIIKGCYDPIPDCYSRDLSEIIDNCLQKNCKDRPSIQEILENERLIEWATELGHLVPTEEEVNDLINGQRTDFMTTFMKKKGSNGDSGKGSGQVGLMSRDKLKNKHYTPGIKNNPVSKPGSKLSNEKSNSKKTSQSVIVDINEISNDAIDAVDRISAENSGSKKKAPVPKYGIYQKPVSARGVGRKLSPNLANKDKAPAVSKKSVSSSDTKATSSDNQNKRGYSKPWIRPKTAGVRTEEVKKNKKDELTDKQKESTRKKASDIMDSRRKQIRPIFNNPTDPKNEEVKEEKRGQNDNKAQNEKEVKRPTHNPIRKTKSDEKPSLRKSMKGHQTDEISIELLENDVEEEMPKNQPKPYIQNSGNHAVPKKAGGMRKMRSAQVDSQLSIPLNQLEDDFEKRNTKEGGENPLLVKKVSKNAETDIPKKRGSNASKMIGDIKKRMKNKGGKSMDANQPGFVDANTEITFSNGTDDVLTTGHVDEVENVKRSYVTNDEEEKLEKYNLSNKSKGSSSVNEANTIEDGEGEGEFEFFDYNDKNFFEDSDLSKTPFGDFGLDAIDENEELDDEEEEGSSAAVKRRIKELTHQKDEKWKELKAGPEYEKSKKWFEYFTKVITDIEDIDNQEKMEDIHIFIKKQNVENYKDLVFSLFQLFNLEKELEAKQDELKELEDN